MDLVFSADSRFHGRQCSGKFEPTTEEASQLFRDAHHLDHMLPILKRLTESVVTLQSAFKRRLRPIASALSKGLTSLPDDLLTLVFEFASPPGEGTRQAVWLSHVSRRFRRVALGACDIWTTLHSNATRKELKTLIARSGKRTDLHVVLHKPADDGDTESFLDACVPLASRWSTLTISSGVDDLGWGELHTVDGALAEIFDHYQLVLPRLHELQIKQGCNEDEDDDEDMMVGKFLPSWATPNLRVIKCDEYIPLPSTAYSALSSFSASLTLASEQYAAHFDALLAFLAAVSTITDFSLTIDILINNLSPLQLANTSCVSLTSLHLQISSLYLPGGADELLHPLIRSLRMPNLANLSVSVELRYDDLLHDEDSDDLCDLLFTILPDPDTHPNLSSFSIELTLTKETKDWGDYIEYKTIVIPLDKIPHVSTLNVKTFSQLHFSRQAGSSDGGQDCALRELRLHDCKQWDSEFLEGLVASLKNVGAWDTLESFKVDQCLWRYESVLKVVGAERLQFSKKEEAAKWLNVKFKPLADF